jgi:hypothetical protein
MRMVRTGAVAMALVLGLGATACSSDKEEKTAPTTAPESRRTSDTEVRAGLVKLNATAVTIAASAAVDKDKAKSLVDDIEPTWQPIEGTIKANDQDTYLKFEDSFAVLEDAAKSGNAAKAAGAVKDMATGSAAYLAKHPG